MADRVIYQDGDDLSELNLALTLGLDNLSDYVERGYEINPDHQNETVDIGNTTNWGNLVIIQDSDQKGWLVLADQRTGLSLPDTSGTNYIYVSIDPTSDDDVSVEVNSSDSPNRTPALKIGEVDAGSDSKTLLNRQPTQSLAKTTLTDDLDDDQSNVIYDYSAQQIAAGVVNEEKVEDTVNALLSASGNISLTYDDANDTLTVDTSALNAEEVEDQVNALVSSSSNLSWAYDDPNDTLTISLSGPITGKQIGTSSNRSDGFFSTVDTEDISVTNARVWTKDGSTSTSTSSSLSYTLSGTYDLVIVEIATTTDPSNNDSLQMQVNGDTNQNYTARRSDGTEVTSNTEFLLSGNMRQAHGVVRLGGRFGNALPMFNGLATGRSVRDEYGSKASSTSPVDSVTIKSGSGSNLNHTIRVFGTDQ